MKVLKSAVALLVVLTLAAAVAPNVAAEQGENESITITIDRATMPSTIFFPGRIFTKAQTLTVHDFVIRDYDGIPIDGFVIQTSSGQTKVPINLVQEIRPSKWVNRYSDDIDFIENVTHADMVLTDGTEMNVLMNADFGTIEGKTEDGDFFLGNPYTVRRLVFNR